ncbi:hypothetical protein GCM10007392_23340 [Saccharospirillum salsuginis]|uniref:Uncharacterized protein n=1 Tax=Saccharospirillum salsuginis TaxID=418750 RepID=A0A918KAL5_9GAMM|nr:hypothetical protein GCM10007392_23340 [Saccharospirillum salsuginis]
MIPAQGYGLGVGQRDLQFAGQTVDTHGKSSLSVTLEVKNRGWNPNNKLLRIPGLTQVKYFEAAFVGWALPTMEGYDGSGSPLG